MYLWVKTLHVIAIISWMAGLLYLPRLFVYHAELGPGPQSAIFKIMEQKLLKYIMAPAMLVSWATGLLMAWQAGYFAVPWFHVKLLAVVAMTAIHFWDASLAWSFAHDANTRSSRFFRFYNELPTLLMIVIVICAIVKPFG
jgi:putative membrane protein